MRNIEKEKKSKYGSDCETRHATFTPLCLTIDGLLAPKMSQFIKHLAVRLSMKWDLKYSTILYWARSKLSLSLVRATNLCIRGSRSKWRGLGFEDGGGLIDSHFN